MDLLVETLKYVHFVATSWETLNAAQYVETKIEQLQKQLDQLRDFVEDTSLSDDDLSAIDEGLEDFATGNARKL